MICKKETTPKIYKNKKAENYNSDKGEKKKKKTEKQLSDLETISLQGKDFRLIMKDIGNKLEAKIDNLKEALSKKIQDLKLKQAEMQNIITNKKFIRSNQ